MAAFRPRPERVSLSNAVKLLESGKFLSVPLSQHLALGMPLSKSNFYLLFYMEVVIGRLKNTKKAGRVISLDERQFQQEVVDHIRLTGEADGYTFD